MNIVWGKTGFALSFESTFHIFVSCSQIQGHLNLFDTKEEGLLECQTQNVNIKIWN